MTDDLKKTDKLWGRCQNRDTETMLAICTFHGALYFCVLCKLMKKFFLGIALADIGYISR